MDSKPKNGKNEQVLAAIKNECLGRLTAGVAHSINNPLSGIVQAVQLLERGLTLDNPKTKNRLIEEYGFDEEMIGRLNRYLEDRGVGRFLKVIDDCAGDVALLVKKYFLFAKESDPLPKLLYCAEFLENSLFLARHHYDIRKSFDFKSFRVSLEANPESLTMTTREAEAQFVMLELVYVLAERLFSEKGSRQDFTPTLTIRCEAAESKDDDVAISLLSNAPMDELEYLKMKQALGSDDLEASKVTVAAYLVRNNLGGRLMLLSDEVSELSFRLMLPKG